MGHRYCRNLALKMCGYVSLKNFSGLPQISIDDTLSSGAEAGQTFSWHRKSEVLVPEIIITIIRNTQMIQSNQKGH
jgi:hypothetical protein